MGEWCTYFSSTVSPLSPSLSLSSAGFKVALAPLTTSSSSSSFSEMIWASSTESYARLALRDRCAAGALRRGLGRSAWRMCVETKGRGRW